MKRIGKKKDDSIDTVEETTDSIFYIFRGDAPIWARFVWLIDLFLISLLYVLLGFFFAWFLDKYLVKKLDRSDSKFFVFIQCIGESMYLIISFFIILMIGRIIPNLFQFAKPPMEHSFWRNYAAGFFVIFGLFAADPNLQDKLRFVFDPEDDKEKLDLESIIGCWTDNNGGGGGWTDNAGNTSCNNYRN